MCCYIAQWCNQAKNIAPLDLHACILPSSSNVMLPNTRAVKNPARLGLVNHNSRDNFCSTVHPRFTRIRITRLFFVPKIFTLRDICIQFYAILVAES